jgi:hypothetical protein
MSRRVWARLEQGTEDLNELDLNTGGIRTLLDSMVQGDEEAAGLCFALLALLSWKKQDLTKRVSIA